MESVIWVLRRGGGAAEDAIAMAKSNRTAHAVENLEDEKQ